MSETTDDRIGESSGNGSTGASRRRPMPNVRTVSRDSRFGKLRALKCFNEIHERILAGWSMAQVAKFVQEDRDEYTDTTHGALASILQDYRDSIPRAELVSRRMPNVFHKAAEEVEKGIDELKELEKLYQCQMERIQIDLTVEKQIKKLFPTMTNEVRLARDILSTYAQLKMDLGLATRHLGHLDVDATLVADVAGRYGKQSVARVVQDPESRRRVLGIAEKLLEAARLREDDEVVVDDAIVTAEVTDVTETREGESQE